MVVFTFESRTLAEASGTLCQSELVAASPHYGSAGLIFIIAESRRNLIAMDRVSAGGHVHSRLLGRQEEGVGDHLRPSIDEDRSADLAGVIDGE